MYDITLLGGLVYDGLGNPPQYKDIGIIGERIARIGDLKEEPCRERIYIKGLSICPGFIDIHSHSDAYYFIHPQAECKIRQGVTTEVIGNCGGSGAPLYGEFKEKRKREWESIGIRIRWNSFRDYVNLLRENGINVNVVPLVGHGNIRGAIKGYSTSPLTKRELYRMQALLERCLEDGAFGLSSGLIYTPGMYADTKELIDLVKIVRPYKGIYTTHIRGEGDTLLSAINESIKIAEETGVGLQISHLKTSGRRNWRKLPEVFKAIEDAISSGVDVTCDRYPYIASNTDLDTLLPDWFHNLSEGEKKDVIKTKRKVLADSIKIDKDIIIGRVKRGKDRWCEGMFVRDIAKRLKMDQKEVILRLLEDSEFQIQATFFNMCERNLKKILRKPYCMIGSDSSLRTTKGPLKMGHPHPRVFGTFPRVLGRYTGRGLLSMETAIHKMTGMPAKKLGLKDRGRIQEGAYADIVVFNPEEIMDLSTYERPFQYPKGIEYVIVNGQIVLDKGRINNKLSGKVLINV